jgi:DNA-binding transcriptional LysR family regulator
MKRKLDLNLLPIAAALFEERSVSRAAEKLGISQPAASRALQRLRRMVGDPLFVKSRRGVEPTPKAVALAACAREILSKVEAGLLAQPEFHPANYRGTFSISTSEGAEFWLWPEIFRRLKKISPHSTYRLLRIPVANLARQLESGEVDLTVGFFPMLHGSNLIQQGLLKMKSVCLLRADHRVRKAKLTRSQFEKLEHVVVDGASRNLVIDHAISTHHLRRKVALVISGYSSLASILASSDLIATVPLPMGVQLVENAHNLRMIQPPVDFPGILIAQYWEGRFNDDPRNQWLRAVVKEVVNSERKRTENRVAALAINSSASLAAQA